MLYYHKVMKNIVTSKNREWKSWIWQQQNVIRDVRDVKEYFTEVDPSFFDQLHEQSGDRLKFQITPYILSQIPKDISEEELKRDPWFLQFFPLGEVYTKGHDAYNGKENWEFSEEFPTSNIQHKYTNRVLVRFRNCQAYCNFCFEALATLEKKPSKEKQFKWNDWRKTIDYIKNNPEIEEVILSGGEPLLNSDSKLERILNDISNIKDKNNNQKIRFKRIHTRILTLNPYRITDDLINILKEYKINEIALNVAHPSEINHDFEETVGKIKEIGRYAPILVLHIPLLKGINNNTEILWGLFSKAYENNIKPYYLLHTMPHTPYADKQRVSVKDGIKLLKPLWRNKSHIALPEYVIVHYDGKQTVPLELNGTPEFQYSQDKNDNPIIKFLNWKNRWVEYPDVKDTIK